jgi:hypothetical protein
MCMGAPPVGVLREMAMFLALSTEMLMPAVLRALGRASAACLRVASGCIARLAEAHAGRADIDESRALPPFY